MYIQRLVLVECNYCKLMRNNASQNLQARINIIAGFFPRKHRVFGHYIVILVSCPAPSNAFSFRRFDQMLWSSSSLAEQRGEGTSGRLSVCTRNFISRHILSRGKYAVINLHAYVVSRACTCLKHKRKALT